MSVYSEIADEFDVSRKKQWHEFEYFLKIIKEKSKVLDLGCGNGRLYEVLRQKKVEYLGIDLTEELIEKARKHFPDASFEVGDMTDLKLKDRQFDSVFSIAAFHHVPGEKLRHQSVKEMHRVLKKDGLLVLTVWNLFQWKYALPIIKALLSFVFHLGMKYSWNDLWIPWKQHGRKRYYHAFLPGELKSYFKKTKWKIEDFYFVRKGDRVKFGRTFNFILIARKK